MNDDFDSRLHTDILSFINQPNDEKSAFNHLALRLFELQKKRNKPYRLFTRHTLNRLKISDPIDHWSNIPCIPTDAFKSPKYPPTCLSQSERKLHFKTSGTTSDMRGVHYFNDTKIYDTSILSAWKLCGLPDILNLLILTPPYGSKPDSSLCHMMDTLTKSHGSGEHLMSNEDFIDLTVLKNAITNDHPITILGTALAFLHLTEKLEKSAQRLSLPKGSWIMETGGYKGTNRTLSKDSLYTLLSERLSIPADSIWNEYSMTELSSQCYTKGLGAPHVSPPWTRLKVINPETGEQSNIGEPGYLCIIDLANYDSCLGIQTQDIAIQHDSNTFTLIGRDPAAIARGCSRSVDDALSQTTDHTASETTH